MMGRWDSATTGLDPTSYLQLTAERRDRPVDSGFWEMITAFLETVSCHGKTHFDMDFNVGYSKSAPHYSTLIMQDQTSN